MNRYRGFKLGRRLTAVWRLVFRRRRYRPKHYIRLESTPGSNYRQSPSRSISGQPKASTTMKTKLLGWTRHLTRRLRRDGGGGKAFYRLGDKREFPSPLLVEEEVDEYGGGGDGWKKPPPKGYLAVYVGGKKDGNEGGPPQRYLVPVIYFNHPLFGELLREAEEEFGFHHPGGITIPCAAAQFERIRTRIAAAAGGEQISRRSAKFHWS